MPTSTEIAARVQRPRPSPLRTAYLGCVALVFLFMFTPLIFVIWVSLFKNEIITFPPQGYTLRWFGNAWANAAFLNGFISSIEIGVFSMLAGLILGVPASFALVRGRFPGREVLAAFLLSPLIVPGIVAGTAIYIYFVEIELMTGVRMIATLPGFILAHVALTIPWTVRLVSASLFGFDRSVEEAAMNLGAKPFTTFRRITLPLAMLQYLEWKFDPTVAAVSVVQIAIIGAGLMATDRLVKLSKVV